MLRTSNPSNREYQWVIAYTAFVASQPSSTSRRNRSIAKREPGEGRAGNVVRAFREPSRVPEVDFEAGSGVADRGLPSSALSPEKSDSCGRHFFASSDPAGTPTISLNTPLLSLDAEWLSSPTSTRPFAMASACEGWRRRDRLRDQRSRECGGGKSETGVGTSRGPRKKYFPPQDVAREHRIHIILARRGVRSVLVYHLDPVAFVNVFCSSSHCTLVVRIVPGVFRP
ncbi:hypothetical protein M404DRAFT_25819 [Pisolithus tinctorius Marx 270]|uniref:Uncharacterized protein n=1 Tax=Pisolithus tinctorius Marx 270 TaxID=870435 RepID=A0A0C3J838_PISTI|nr:hypothetical protein M404DRAFT_25819 [Pisolithus tinctorius Marx 270]